MRIQVLEKKPSECSVSPAVSCYKFILFQYTMTVQSKRKSKLSEKLLPSSIQLCKLIELITNKQTNPNLFQQNTPILTPFSLHKSTWKTEDLISKERLFNGRWCSGSGESHQGLRGKQKFVVGKDEETNFVDGYCALLFEKCFQSLQIKDCETLMVMGTGGNAQTG